MALKSLYGPSGGSFAVAFLILITVFFGVPLFVESYYAYLTFQSCFSLLILSMLCATSQERSTLIAGLLFVVPFLIFDFLSIIHDSLYLMVIAYSFYCFYLFFVMVVLFKRVIVTTTIDTNLVFGALTVYLLAGILWGRLYFIVNALSPGSFHGIEALDLRSNPLSTGYHNQFDLLYYSFTTLATLGEGDITPLHKLAKSLTALEAMFGQLFIATVIAKMVSSWKADSIQTQGISDDGDRAKTHR